MMPTAQPAPSSSARHAAALGPGPVTGADRLRQIGVLLSEIACIVGTLFGVGVIGTRVEESSGGSLAADATLLAPGVPAFSIWSVVYAGLAAYTVWQLLPAQAANPRARATGWLAAASMLLNAAWLLVTQVGWLWVSVAVILALVVVLGVLVRRLTDLHARGRSSAVGSGGSIVERLVLDATFGLYLGWVAVATCANITATLVASGVQPGPVVAQTLAVVVLVVAAGIGVLLAQRFGGRLAIAAAMAWGLGWIAWARALDEPRSLVTAWAAGAAAVLVVVAALRARSQSRGVDAGAGA